MLGFTLDEVLAPGWDPEDRLAPDQVAAAREREAVRVSGSQLTDRSIVTLLRKDGSPVRCELNVKVIEGGPAPLRVAIVRDVTEREAQDVELKRQKDRYEALVRAQTQLGDAVVIAEGARLAWVTDAFARMTGYSPAELTDAAFDPVAFLRPAERYALDLRRKDGRVVQAEVSAKAIDDPQLERRVVVFRDVTARNAAERILREQRDMYDALLHAQSKIGEGVALVRGHARIEYANEALARILGRPLAELYGRDVNISDLFAPGELERSTAELAGSDPREARHYTAALVQAGGEIVHVEVSSVGVEIRGEPFRLVIVRDVTAEARDADELQAARMRLATTERLAALGGLVSGVAHEIRTPLTIIENNAHLLEQVAKRAAESGDHARLAKLAPSVVSEIVSSIERTNNLVRSLRRFTQQQQSASFGTMDLTAAVREAVALFASAYRGEVSLKTSFVETPPILGDPIQVQQVVINLLDNAREAARHQSGPIEVLTRPSADGGAQLVVRDSGLGMSPEVVKRMFEPLFSTKPNGTGLGLAIVKRIVDEHHAQLRCESERGRGTTMTVAFRSVA